MTFTVLVNRMYRQSILFLFFSEFFTEIGGFNKPVGESTPLSKGIENHLAAIGAAPLAFLFRKDRDLLRAIRLSKKGWLRHRVDKGGLLFRRILLATGCADERLADLLEPVINRFRPYEGDLATGGTVYLSSLRFVHERFGR